MPFPARFEIAQDVETRAGSVNAPATDSTAPPGPRTADGVAPLPIPRPTPAEERMLDEVEKAHFQYFKQESDPTTGLTRDRSKPNSAASIAAVGFSLTAYPTAAERGWVSRDEAADYTLKVLNTLSSTQQGDAKDGTSGSHGFFYHFLDPKTGLRTKHCEVSTIDTAILMSGVLFAESYFDKDDPKEKRIRELAGELYRRVDWNWAVNKDGRVSYGWLPEYGFISRGWEGYNEASLLVLLGMGSPTHPLPASSWDTYMSTSKTATAYGQKFLEFGPLFGHQYPQVWIDFRNIDDKTSKTLGFNYFENSRHATRAQNYYAIDNPQKWRGYGRFDWGLTASDGPKDTIRTIDGVKRQFYAYSERGFPNTRDDGTIAPTAAAASLPFAPELVIPTLAHWLKDRPEINSPIGFKDAFNPTFDKSKPSGWVDKDSLAIDQGPIMLMAENYRSGLVWQVMRKNQYIDKGLSKAGFSGGWLDVRHGTAGGGGH